MSDFAVQNPTRTISLGFGSSSEAVVKQAVILLPAHPASFAHKFLFQRVPGCNSIADLSLKIVFWTQRFAVGTH